LGKEIVMQMKSTPQRYGSVAIALHWISALAILIMLASGLAAANAADAGAKLGILRIHASLGACILALTVMRIVWWLIVDRRPNHPAGVAGWQAAISRLVHYGLYVVIVVLLASGAALAILSGLVPILLGAPGALPDFATFAPRLAHGLAAWVLIGLTSLHIAAALYHQFWRRDRLLARMGVGAR
jgi:cytochrome b561